LDIFEVTEIFYSSKENIHLQSFEETTSTNTLAKNLPPYSGLTVLLARTQTQGRGQFNRLWSNALNPSGQLLVTYAQYFPLAPQPHLTMAIGIALHKSLTQIWPQLDLKLKLPNDLYKKEKKCAGLLLETLSLGTQYHLIIGLGLNVTSYPVEVATSGALFDHASNLTPSQWIQFLEIWETQRAKSIRDSWQALTLDDNLYLERYRI
jgi:BirA family biotin operon repressor/biotin-[acetyl-CoA-carboxylase] ligase